MLLLEFLLQNQDVEANTAMLQVLLPSSSWPPQEHIHLWRREVKSLAPESQLCSCPGEERYSNNLKSESRADKKLGFSNLCINDRKYFAHLLQRLVNHELLPLFNQSKLQTTLEDQTQTL